MNPNNPNRNHLNERELQQYASGSCEESRLRRFHAHLESCPQCRGQAELYRQLDIRLQALGIDPPGKRLTDRVMNGLAFDGATATATGKTLDNGKKRRLWRPELTNVLAASIATYLFVHAGILQTIVSMDAVHLENGMRGGIASVIDLAGRLADLIRY